MSASELFEEVSAELNLETGTTLTGEQMVDMIEELLREKAHPDYETVMVPKEGPSLNYEGVSGLHGGVEIETESGAVWWAVGGQVRRASFYIDRRAGLKAAGIAPPDRPPGD